MIEPFDCDVSNTIDDAMDESEIEFLNDKIDSFKNLLELEEDIEL